jgi:hypothetical protein
MNQLLLAARDLRAATAAAWWLNSAGVTDTLRLTSSAGRYRVRSAPVVAGPVVPVRFAAGERTTTDASARSVDEVTSCRLALVGR